MTRPIESTTGIPVVPPTTAEVVAGPWPCYSNCRHLPERDDHQDGGVIEHGDKVLWAGEAAGAATLRAGSQACRPAAAVQDRS